MCSKGKEVHMGFTGETFPPGVHMCYIYNDEVQRKKVISQFLESGLLNGEKASYFMDVITIDEMNVIGDVLNDCNKIILRGFRPLYVIKFFHFIFSFRMVSMFANTSFWDFVFPRLTSSSPCERSFKIPIAFLIFS